ncbi:MAG TPA: DUF389 domain-containing protein [Amnibacterium sp.]|nr:DUF389 domain-containing protein [Amnibacterium sp.]
MLHLAVVAPRDRSAGVVDALREEPGVTNLLTFEGAALKPPGDLIEADVAREAADAVLDRLHALCIEHGGTVTISGVDAAFGDPVEAAERDAPGEGVDAVVWQEISQRTAADATLSATFLVFLMAATLISSVGLLTDSSVLVVGGMVLGPEFGPLAAVAVALVQRRWRAAWRSLTALLIGFPLAVAVTAGAVVLLRVTAGLPAGYLAGHRPLTSFVAHPDVFSVVTALIAGAAGMVSLTASRSGALVGVFISVTTIPAAANIGTALVAGHPEEAAGAAIQLGVNVLCILVAATVTLLVQRWALRRRSARRPADRWMAADRLSAPRRRDARRAPR